MRPLCVSEVAALLLMILASACAGPTTPAQPTPVPQPTEIATPTVAPTAAPTGPAQSASKAPHFTHPTEITNPFYPVSRIGQSISLGMEGGKPARNEVTLLPDTRMVTWDGQNTEARVAQFVAYTDGKLVEVAYDSFAQADDGDVYYLGEDVSNYSDGQVVDHGGSWLAGKDGAPPALIMPAHPQVGQMPNQELCLSHYLPSRARRKTLSMLCQAVTGSA